jgi:opacity protein-like surface antigen
MQFGGIIRSLCIAFTLCGASTAVYATNGAPYLGLQLGANSGGSWNLTNPEGATTHFGMSGESFGILGGYGQFFGEKWYLAGEGFLNDSVIRTANKSTDNAGTTIKLRTTYSYGISILPGYNIAADTRLFVRAGLVGTRFELTQSHAAQSSSATAANTVSGGQLGVGVALSLSKNLALRGEYVYTGYQSFTAYGNKVSPRSNQLLASFTYQFT